MLAPRGSQCWFIADCTASISHQHKVSFTARYQVPSRIKNYSFFIPLRQLFERSVISISYGDVYWPCSEGYNITVYNSPGGRTNPEEGVHWILKWLQDGRRCTGQFNSTPKWLSYKLSSCSHNEALICRDIKDLLRFLEMLEFVAQPKDPVSHFFHQIKHSATSWVIYRMPWFKLSFFRQINSKLPKTDRQADIHLDF